MKLILATFFVLSFLGFSMPGQMAHAQDLFPQVPSLSVTDSTANLKKLSNQFYKRCHEKPDATLNDLAQEEYCVCLSAQMYRKSLTLEERQYLATGEGVPMEYNRALAEVYGHCIGIPGRAATYNMCTVSPNAYKLVKGEDDLNRFCNCIIHEMSDFWDVMAPAFLEAEVSYGRDISDPLTHIMKGRDFPVKYSLVRSSCVSQYGRRD